MISGLDDDRFLELQEMYQSKEITSADVLSSVCHTTKSYDVALNDFEMVVDRNATKEEKNFIRIQMYAKNNKKNK